MLNVPSCNNGNFPNPHHQQMAESRTMTNVTSQQHLTSSSAHDCSNRRITGSSLSLNALDAETRDVITERSALLNNQRLSASYERSKGGGRLDEAASQLLFAPIIDVKMQFILVGDKSVGKSCFLQRYADDMFSQHTTSTVGIDFKQKMVTFPGHKVRLHIWDTAGQERFNSITTAYYRNARGVILFYDVTNRRSFDNLVKWLELVKKYARDDAILAIVGNKTDIGGPKVDREEAKKFAASHAQLFYEASAKESYNVEDVFNELVVQVLRKMPKMRDASPNRMKQQQRKRMVVLRPLTEEKTKDWCCVTN